MKYELQSPQREKDLGKERNYGIRKDCDEKMAGENVKVWKTYHLENYQTQEVIGEGESNGKLQFGYYNNGMLNVLTQVVVGTITDTEVVFFFLGADGFTDDNRSPVKILSDQLVDWKIKVADYYLTNERTEEELHATATTQDSEYTYLGMPEGHYDKNSKVRTKNSNIQRIVNLGTGTSFNVTSYAGYQNFTASNFVIEFVGVNSSRGTELQSGWDDLPNFGAHSGIETSASGLSKSYNPTTGILSVSASTVSRVMGDHWQYEKGRVTASITLRAYLII